MSNFAFCRGLVLIIACAAGGLGVSAAAQEQKDQQATTATATQTKPPTGHTTAERQKIGLVFNGGGALGFAHIGVIQWMEEHHIPVDYVSGTSMGGLVGGLYASGLSVDEIRAFVRTIDWQSVLSGQVPFQALSFRRKEDKLAFPNRFEFGLKNGFGGPAGLNTGAAVGLLFDRTLLPYWNLQNFDDLPIPFRCVATELISGRPHVFADGSLPQALRATMSIPGVFSPVRHGDQIFSDGGALDNLPVDVARSMGAQVVISSYLDTGPTDPRSLNSLAGVVGRNVSIMVAANEVPSLKNSDIVISSDVSKFGTMEFARSDEIIPLGYKTAEQMAPQLEKYALNDAEWEAYMARRHARRRTEVPVPQFIQVYGITGMQQADIEARLEKYVGNRIDPDQLEKGIAELLGTGLYSTINYTIVERNGQYGLLIRPRNKTYGPPFMNFGLTILANDSNNVQMGLGLRATFHNLVGPGSEVRLDGAVGQPALLSGELFKPIKAGSHFFIAPNGYLSHQINPYFQGSEQLEEYREKRNGLGIDFGYQFNTRTELRFGQGVQWYSQHRTIGTAVAQEFSLVPLVSKVRLQYFGQNDVMVPTQGSIVSTTYNYYTKRPNGSGGYSQMEGSLEHFIPLGSRDSLFTIGRGGTSFGADNLGLAGLNLGGPLRLTAYSRNELLGTDYFLGQVGYLHKILQLNPVIADSVYVGGLYEIGKMYGGNPQTPTLPNNFAAAVIAKTLFGPLFGGVAIGDSDHRKWFLGLGRVF
jgi:NTE family protein